MLDTLGRLVKSSRRFVPLIPKVAEQQLSALFARTAFYLQGQMDINPRSMWYKDHFVEMTGGFFPPAGSDGRSMADLEPWDCVRRDMLVLLLRSIAVRGLAGDLAEVGVYHGRTAKLIHHYMPERVLHLFDTFSGFHEQDVRREASVTGFQASTAQFADTSEEAVRRHIGGVSENVRTYVGLFPETWPSELDERTFAFVHLDADLYEPTLAGLRHFYPRVARGGFVVVHDYNAWPGARRAVDEFFADRPEVPIPMPDKSGSVVITKQ
jgi:O-methyltransferase